MPGTTELLIILLVVIVIFGAGKLRNIGSDLGGALRSFKEGMQEKNKCIIGKNYPFPIVEHTLAVKKARLKIAEVYKKVGFRDGSKLVFNKLGSRKKNRVSKKIDNQLQLL